MRVPILTCITGSAHRKQQVRVPILTCITGSAHRKQQVHLKQQVHGSGNDK